MGAIGPCFDEGVLRNLKQISFSALGVRRGMIGGPPGGSTEARNISLPESYKQLESHESINDVAAT